MDKIMVGDIVKVNPNNSGRTTLFSPYLFSEEKKDF